MVTYNANYQQYGLAAPSFFVPRDPKIDAPDDIVRRGESPVIAE